MNMEPIITARSLNKIYKTKSVRMNALNNVNLDIMPGEFCAILGTSGSGKSTLLSLLAGLEYPTSGKIFVNQKPIHRMSEGQLVEFRLQHTGFIFQSFNLMPTMTVLENAAFALACQGVKKSEREKRAKELLTTMGLAGHLNHKPMELSGGQQQRVAIARAIISQPKIIFADEPTGNLDSRTSEEIMDILQTAVRLDGSTMLMVTHDKEKARYADRVIQIMDGRIVKDDLINSHLSHID
jgi:putative ABC transport system ATP-binding protein